MGRPGPQGVHLVPQRGNSRLYKQYGTLWASCLGTNIGLLLSQAWFPRKPGEDAFWDHLERQRKDGSQVSRDLLLIFHGIHKAHPCPSTLEGLLIQVLTVFILLVAA